MNRFRRLAPFTITLLLISLLLVKLPRAAAQTLRDLNETLDQIEPSVSQGATNPNSAEDAIDRLDQAEADFARVAEQGRVDQEELLTTYHRLERMLDRMYQTYENQKEACIDTIGRGGNCDYEQPEQLALRALYPLSW